MNVITSTANHGGVDLDQVQGVFEYGCYPLNERFFTACLDRSASDGCFQGNVIRYPLLPVD